MMKKIIAMALAAVMALGMSAMTMGAQTEGTTASIKITTDATLDGASANTYQAYKIFDAQYTSLSGANTQADKDTFSYPEDAKVAYFMKTGNPWIATVQSMAYENADDAVAEGKYFDVAAAADGSGYTVVLHEGVAETADTAKEIAAKLKAALSGLSLSGDYEGIDVTAGGDAVDVQPGYYLIASDTATNLQLITTNVEMVEKNEYTHDEKVAETASVSIGESATYYVKVYIPANVNTDIPVVVHDNLDQHLHFNDDVKFYINAADPTVGLTTEAEKAAAYKALNYNELTDAYQVIPKDDVEDDCDFEIKITTSKDATTGNAGKYIVFKYSAELLATADADGDGFVNSEFVSYSDYETTPSNPKVNTYDFDILKTDGTNNLDGAIFQLKNSDGTVTINMFKTEKGYKKVDKQTSTNIDAEPVTNIEVNSKTTGTVTNISGLGAGIYQLVETSAPTGFNLLDAPVIVTITDSGKVSATLKDSSLGETANFNIVNQSGTVLPSTGGIGTTIFYVLGAILVLGGGILLVSKRRAA